MSTIWGTDHISFEEGELTPYLEAVGNTLFTENLRKTMHQFRESDNLGSLIRPQATDVSTLRGLLETRNIGGNIFLHKTHDRVLQALRYAEFLGTKYHVVIANPPYMGAKGMNARLKSFLEHDYADVKIDLFSAFIVRIMEMTQRGGFLGLMTPFNWMFLSSFERLRKKILSDFTVTNLVRPEFHAFFDSAYVSVCGFTLFGRALSSFKGSFIDLNQFYGADVQPLKTREAIQDPHCGWLHHAATSDFRKIPGSPIAYWLGSKLSALFSFPALESRVSSGGRCKTHNDAQFVRFVWEVSSDATKWKLFNKGGEARKWYGNYNYVFDWSDSAKQFYQQHGGLSNSAVWDRSGITWSGITSSRTTFRLKPQKSEYASVSPTIIVDDEQELLRLLGALNSNIIHQLIRVINPTMMVNVGDALKLPDLSKFVDPTLSKRCIDISKLDWDFYENSADFTQSPLLKQGFFDPSLNASYKNIRQHWYELTTELHRLEHAINHKLVESCDLTGELQSDVRLDEITLTCNPYFQYGMDKSDEDREKLLVADTMKDFLSYAVGCMFGRYSVDKAGLVLANQGETSRDYVTRVPESRFSIDDDNIVPMLEGEWFSDDICERFRKFLRVAFGDTHYQDNLQFIETALGKDIRKYFLRDFYSDHVKRYKKRPIYWLFSSPKGSFNALIYMHRYRPDTASVVLNDYLREFRTKLNTRKSHLEQVSISTSANQSEKTKAVKEIDKLKKVLDEIEEYEREVLYPLAAKRIEIDLNDGVRINYAKFGAALKPISGLEAIEE